MSDGVVLLRRWHEADAPQIFEACQDARIQRFLPLPRPYRHQDAVDYIARTWRQWDDGTKAAFAIVDAKDHDVVLGAIAVAIAGTVGNAAYWVAPDARRRGVASRALQLLTDWAFRSLGLGIVLLEIRPENVASQRVATACGYHEAGHLDVNTDTGEQDNLLFSRLAVPVPARSRPAGVPSPACAAAAPMEHASATRGFPSSPTSMARSVALLPHRVPISDR